MDEVIRLYDKPADYYSYADIQHLPVNIPDGTSFKKVKSKITLPNTGLRIDVPANDTVVLLAPCHLHFFSYITCPTYPAPQSMLLPPC